MSLIVVLFVLGLLMLSLEIFLPGGILGVMGALTLLAAAVLSYRDHGAMGGSIALLLALALTVATFYVEFVVLPKTRVGRSFVLSSVVTGKATQAADVSLVGRPCEAATVLSPSGTVVVDGHRYEAFCRDGFVEAGTKLVVQGTDNFRLIVSKLS